MDADNARRRRVHLRHVPIRDFVQLQVYFDDMVREMQLIAVGNSDQGAEGRLADLASYVQHDIAGTRSVLHGEALEAMKRGQSHVDLWIDLMPDSLDDARRLIEVAEALDAQSRRGMMLTAPASREIIGLLRWIVDQVERQLGAGAGALPYADRSANPGA